MVTRLIEQTLFAVFVTSMLLMSNSVTAATNTQEHNAQKILGWVEFIRLEPWGIKMRARLDTGANTSSMSARDISQFRKNRKQWVRFTFDFKTETGERSIEIERPLVKVIKIKRHDGPSQERPVITMEVCLADEVREIEFDLIDRRALNYPVLLGRKALAGYALVDSARSYLGKADCGHKKKKNKSVDSAESGKSE